MSFNNVANSYCFENLRLKFQGVNVSTSNTITYHHTTLKMLKQP